MPLTTNKIFKIDVVGEDCLTVLLSVNDKVSLSEGFDSEQIIKDVKELGIVIDQSRRAELDDLIGNLAEAGECESVVIAQGTPPVHDQNGKIEKLFEQLKNREAEGKNSQSHYDCSSFINVAQGQKLLRIVTPVAGTDGIDVYGKAIPRKLGREVEIKLGDNVKREGDLIIAAANGKLEFEDNKISVKTILEIPGTVDFSVGNIDFEGDVVIHQNVVDLFRIKSRSNITVHGIVEAAEIRAGRDINCLGGVAGKEKGKIEAGHDIYAKYITNATVTAGNDVRVLSEIVHCNVVCAGRVEVEKGPLVGGHIIAAGGMKVKYLGSEAGVKTIVEVGIYDALRRKCDEVAPQIKKLRNKSAKVRKVVEPLLMNQKQLNSEQKEKATELLYQADELEGEAQSLIDELREVYDQAEEKSLAEIEVTGGVFAGVIVRCPRVDAVTDMMIKGPLKIMPHKEHGIYNLVAVDGENGSRFVMNSSSTMDDLWDRLDELLNITDEN